MKIQVSPLPDFVFLEQSFPVSLTLLNEESNCLVIGQTPVVHVYLCYTDMNNNYVRVLSRNQIISIDTVNLQFSKEGILSFNMSVNELSVAHENRSFSIQIKCEDNVQIEDGFSTSFKCVRYKLSVDYDVENNIWYKDEGGKKNCITLHIRLLDVDDKIVSLDNADHRLIPLTYDLQYDAPESLPVNRQLLKVLDDKSEIGLNGECDCHLRIEDVSKNHQQRKFIINILPNYYNFPQNWDIAPVSTPPILVKSKRNKDNKAIKRPADFFGDKHDFASDSQRKPLGIDHCMSLISEYLCTTFKVVKELEWQTIGCEPYSTNMKINRCPYCYVYRDGRNPQAEHTNNCLLKQLSLNNNSVIHALEELNSTLLSPTVPSVMNISPSNTDINTSSSLLTHPSSVPLSTSTSTSLPTSTLTELPPLNTIPNNTQLTNNTLHVEGLFSRQDLTGLSQQRLLGNPLLTQGGPSVTYMNPRVGFPQSNPLALFINSTGQNGLPPNLGIISTNHGILTRPNEKSIKSSEETVSYVYISPMLSKTYGAAAFNKDNAIVGLYTLNQTDSSSLLKYIDLVKENTYGDEMIESIVSLCNNDFKEQKAQKIVFGTTKEDKEKKKNQIYNQMLVHINTDTFH
ncbi:hypothetical protein WA158_006190 [Blastocystis sp. Blastoise]